MSNARTKSSANSQNSNAASSMSAAAARAVEPIVNAAESFASNNFKSMNQGLSQFAGNLKQNSQEAIQTMTNQFEEINAFNNQTIQTSVSAFNTLAQSFEQISKLTLQLGQTMFEANVAAVKQLLAVKNAQEAFDIQSTLVKDNIDQIISNGTKLSQVSIEAANKALAPIQSHFNQAVENVVKKAA